MAFSLLEGVLLRLIGFGGGGKRSRLMVEPLLAATRAFDGRDFQDFVKQNGDVLRRFRLTGTNVKTAASESRCTVSYPVAMRKEPTTFMECPLHVNLLLAPNRQKSPRPPEEPPLLGTLKIVGKRPSRPRCLAELIWGTCHTLLSRQ